MANNIQVRETKEVEVGGNQYILTALGTTDGINTMNKLTKLFNNGQEPDGEFVRDLIIATASYNKKAFDTRTYEIHFSKKYNEVFELFAEIIEFNFDIKLNEKEEGDSPNE